jgi:hypothetical protein
VIQSWELPGQVDKLFSSSASESPRDGDAILTPRPEYDPANRLADRIEAKLHELPACDETAGGAYAYPY